MNAQDTRRATPLAGLGNQTRREAASWWTTGRWRRQTAIWMVLLAGLFTLMHWVLPAALPDEAGLPATTVNQTAQQFTELVAIVMAIGVVLLTQGVILDERRNGVLEWLLSKPLTRPALIVAKFVGHGTGLVATVVAGSSIAVFLLLSVASGQVWPVGRVIAAFGMLALVVVFHLALVLAISTVTSGRVAVLALPLSLIVGADLIAAIMPFSAYVLPWSLGRIAGAVLSHGILVTGWPLIATVGWTAVLLLVAIWRLERAEL